ncbi:MAG TPA: NAD-dependent epimerase/dehydratase family protein [Gemmatimonadales bacterium]|nr:NAD-dependent epimerase/dehydratase family protein [Gemmatimonadales bacterium]
MAVLGGAGFIGSNLALRLAGLGAAVTVIDGLVAGCGGHPANLQASNTQLPFLRANLAVDPVPASVLDAEVVFDLMGDPAHGRSVRDPRRDLTHNLLAQIALFEAIRRGPHRPLVVLASTRSVYGRPVTLPVAEDHPLAPPDPNGIHKLAAEQYAIVYGRLYDLDIVRLRLTNVYGPRQGNADPAHGVSGFLLGRLLRGEPVQLFGGGIFRRDWLMVDDAVEALLAAGAAPTLAGQVINVGHDAPASLREFVTVAVELLGRGAVVDAPLPPEQQAIDVGDYWTDPRLAERALGWRALIPLREGLSRTLDFYTRSPDGARWPPESSLSLT